MGKVLVLADRRFWKTYDQNRYKALWEEMQELQKNKVERFRVDEIKMDGKIIYIESDREKEIKKEINDIRIKYGSYPLMF